MIEYQEYLKEKLFESIAYSEYVAEQIDRNISYTEYLSGSYDTKNFKRKIKIKNLFN